MITRTLSKAIRLAATLLTLLCVARDHYSAANRRRVGVMWSLADHLAASAPKQPKLPITDEVDHA